MMTTEALLRHAKRYGHDGVAETAAEFGDFTLDELTELLIQLDKLEQADKPAILRRHKKIDVRAVAEARAKKLLHIPDDDKETT
jgi:hypothetical protein